MIKVYNKQFSINTKNTSYCFSVLKTGHLKHDYYGALIDADSNTFSILEGATKYPAGNLVTYSKDYSDIALENECLEISSLGKGDVREPFVEIGHVDGSLTSDFIYESFEVNKGDDIVKPEGLPSANNPDEQLVIKLVSKNTKVYMELFYNLFEEADCITRYARLINEEDSSIKLYRLLSNQIDFFEGDYEFVNFSGGWAREMNMNCSEVIQGKLINSSITGMSSNRNNPFTILKKSDTTENYGECYGFNLIYSGNHYTCVERNTFGKTRLVNGINPNSFTFVIEPGNDFWACEAVMTYSENGLTGMSHNMHYFVKNHIVRGEWTKKSRPVLFNSWEAAYFKFDEGKLLSMAKNAKSLGIELFVMDDGWFGNRDNDACSLGDWDCNLKKLPNGLKGLGDKLNKLGLEFGIWLEPEMINVDSELYRKHPDWAVSIPGKDHSEGRNQRFLDYTRQEVRDYIVSKVNEILGSANIAYVKWDMNRIFSDTFSISLDNQKEFMHRYMLGLYNVLDRITTAFPKVLFEGCASGGNRFDLGILCYMPQIWASDNTDAWCRAVIQTGLSYGYPMSVVGAHVSGSPNHQTLRNTLLSTRFNVAACANLGYEMNLSDLSDADKTEIAFQIMMYKQYRDRLFDGDFYRIDTGKLQKCGNTTYEWMLVSKDKSIAVAVQIQNIAVANYPDAFIKLKGLSDEKLYHFYNVPKKYDIRHFGDLINTVSPIHVKQNSLLHNTISKFVKMDSEVEDYKASGRSLNKCGVRLHKNYAGVGYDNEVRFCQDFGSRLFIIEEDS